MDVIIETLQNINKIDKNISDLIENRIKNYKSMKMAEIEDGNKKILELLEIHIKENDKILRNPAVKRFGTFKKYIESIEDEELKKQYFNLTEAMKENINKLQKKITIYKTIVNGKLSDIDKMKKRFYKIDIKI